MLISLISLISCKKYLDAKSNAKLLVPSTIQDLQGLLDYHNSINFTDNSAAEIGSDNYYITNDNYLGLPQNFRNQYLWEKEFLFSLGVNDWSSIYDNVYLANIVLDNIHRVSKDKNNESEWNNLKGQALFLRAKSFLQVAFVWSLAYDARTSSSDFGIPLRLNSDFNIVSNRSSVEETYRQIINDLRNAIPLLSNTPTHIVRSSKAAAYGFLSRTYLSMRKYEEALLYADSCLSLKNTLLDYNEPAINPTATYPFSKILYNNPEIIYECRMATPTTLRNTIAKIDSILYKSYDLEDLRKTVFFKNNYNGTFGFKGSYEGSLNLFDGITTAEIYLNRAECYARSGNLEAAMADLNTLLKNRWKTGMFEPFIATDTENALLQILRERRKELIMRGLRWIDIKRLNKEGDNIVLRRVLNGELTILEPNSPRYALPIPDDIISLSGMIQNPR